MTRSTTGSLIVLLCAIAIAVVIADVSYYDLLGVKRNATPQQLKSAFKKLAFKYHPDRNPDPDAHTKFIEISAANEVLKDKKLRKIYDQHGKDGIERHKKGEQAGGAATGFASFEDLFFGGGRRGAQEQRGPDIEMDLVVTLETIYSGSSMSVLFSGQSLCSHCGGSGAESEDDFQECRSCNGQGVKTTRQMFGYGMYQQVQTKCEVCHGTGKVIKKKCHVCHGKKVNAGQRKIDVEIERGVKDGELLEFENAADETPDMPAGHIIMKIITAPHSRFTRHDITNLKIDLDISLVDALTGFSKSIPHLDGHAIKISRKQITNPGARITVHGEGLPVHENSSEFGDLHVTARVLFPTSLTSHQRTALEALLPK